MAIGNRFLSYVADPSMGHGQFRLNNGGTVAVTAKVELAWLEFKVKRGQI
jgi:hypothetical protein